MSVEQLSSFHNFPFRTTRLLSSSQRPGAFRTELFFFRTMSRPASESLTTAKRTRTVSSCAESVERPLYALETHTRHVLPHALSHPSQPPLHAHQPTAAAATTSITTPLPLTLPVSQSVYPVANPTASVPTSPPQQKNRKRSRITDTAHDARVDVPAPTTRRSSAHRRTHERSDYIRERPRQRERSRQNHQPHLMNPLAHPVHPRPPSQHGCLPLHDDAEGHLVYNLGDGLYPVDKYPNGRYKILSELGEGTFGKVVECWDRRDGRRVAIKVVRSVTKYREAARLEIDVLLHLKTHDPKGYYHCVKLYSCFDYRSHVCMVFEKLGPSLYEHLRRNRFRPFPLNQVRDYAFQLLESVNFVHSLTLIHTDLKPENILLVDNKRSSPIKLIDFGSATFESQHHSAVISTRHYRAPEVILGLGWTYPCDLWSIGCILVELYTGQALFQTHENLEHLAMMSGVLGPIPESMMRRADISSQNYFIRRAGGRRDLNWPAGASSKDSVRSVRKIQALEDIIRRPDGHPQFIDLVRRLLAFEPDTRCTSAEALRHPFFRDIPNESDPPATTPTLSSGSSACGSGAHATLLRPHYKVAGKRKPVQHPAMDRLPGAPANAPAQPDTDRIDDEGDDTATETHTAVEHSDHTVFAAPNSPHCTAGNSEVT